ncbi:MAG: FeoA family protein [Planctomycetota bacterium]
MNSQRTQEVIPLIMLPASEDAQVVEVRGGKGMSQRLSSMGIYPGQTVSLINSNPAGPVIVKIQGTRVAIGRGMAHRVMVETT